LTPLKRRQTPQEFRVIHNNIRFRNIRFLVVLLLVCNVSSAQVNRRSLATTTPGQETREAKAPLRIDFEILMQSQPSYRINAQEWGRALQPSGYSPRFRQPAPGEAVRIENVDRGETIEVHVVAGMVADGSLRLGADRFQIADVDRLIAFLDELARFGAAGPPESDPRWGLTDEQLLEVTRILSEPLAADVALESPMATLSAMGLPDRIRLNFTDAAREVALGRKPPSAPESLALTGFTKGTAIAIVLSQYGLGFRPQATLQGDYALEIDRGGEVSNLWPTGWKTKEVVSSVLPAYLKSIPVTNVNKTPASEIVAGVSNWLKIPQFDSSWELAAAGRELAQLTYTRADGKMTPGALLMALSDKFELGFDVRCDEAGKLFLWCTTQEEAKAFRTRFTQVKQK
jgi:hypothetical protein